MIKIFDGAMGTMLQQAGLPAGACPELWNIENPTAITNIHRQYIQHGADIIETNTFGANRIKLSHYHLEDIVQLINISAVQAARAAAGEDTLLAGSVGPTGKFVAPLGELSFDDAYNIYKEQISVLSEAGVDMIIIETIIDIQEMRAALLAAKAVTNIPVVCQLSFGADGRTVTGTDPATAATLLDAMGADVIGANCSLGPAQLLPVAEAIASATTKPVSIQANAGMPGLVDGKTVFPMSPEEMADWVPKLVEAGVSYLGGCCGTTPQHIQAISQAATGLKAVRSRHCSNKITKLTSRSQTVSIGAGLPTVIIGERINPTGRKQLSADIKQGNFASAKREALQQIRAGARVLDVNMGVPGIDQAAAMEHAVKELCMLVDAPLSLDTSDAAALEAGLKIYPGRALINSVTAEPDRLEKFLPLAKRYGAAILCLPISQDGVPATADERVRIIREIIHRAFAAGLRPQDFILDALVLTAAADSRAALETLETLRQYREHFGYPATMGLSNISFGLPRRELINASFCAMSLAAGLDAPILNPYNPMMKDSLASSNILLGYDPSGHKFSKEYSSSIQQEEKTQPTSGNNTDLLSSIRQTVIDGEKEAVIELVRQALNSGYSSSEVTDKALTAAMNVVGEDFGAGRCFLPQVLLSAETMRSAFNTIKEQLPASSSTSKGIVVLATVKGDIHDLGKNIVAALLENNGYTVVDLGKDVAPDVITQAALKHGADVVGLCALMTTTMPEIDSTIKSLRDNGCKARTIVGGAVLTSDYAEKAGADGYAADGVAAVNLVKGFCSTK